MKHALEFVTKEGIDPYAMGTLVRTASASLQRLALQQVEGLIQDIARTQNVTDTQARMIAGEIAPSQAAQLQPLIDHIWRRQYAEAVRTLTTTAIAQRGFSTDDRDFPLVRAVGFADLVDFTERTKDTSAHEFNALIRDFTDVCWDIVNSRGGRIISFLGDAVFFVADDIKTGVEVSLGLSEHGQTGMCGPVRVGLVWTRVLKANGDVFGPGVNLVSRITRAATPNEVFIDDSLAERLARNPDYSIVEEPAFDARGIGWVQPFRIRYADDPRNQEDE
jgi:adenylate cyclase